MCTCKICEYNREAQARLAALPLEHRPFFEEMYSELTHTQVDLDYRNCLIDGSNDDADKIINNIRIKRIGRLAAEPATNG